MNTKSLETLKEVSGIGDSTLDNFRDYGFESLDDLKGISRSELKDVPGIGAATANSILRLLEREGLRTKSMRTERQESFQELLKKLFKFDMADLDFGIYRIMNHKRDEINQFIDKGLLEVIDEELESYSVGEAGRKEEKLGELKAEIIEDLGEEAITPNGGLKEIYKHTPLGKRYETLKEEIEEEESSDPVEVQVFNDLINFLKFYYNEGDFVTKRRYSREQKYAVPYNGEEVYLHWANKEQYYIKTGEQFKDYEFRLPGDYHVSFELKNAEDEQHDQKGEDKFFLLHRHDPIKYEPGERKLTVLFEHRPLDDLDMDDYELSERSQKRTWKKNIKGQIVEKVLETTEGKGDFHKKLTTKERGEEKIIFEKHLDRYTKKYEADYFIHKDLGDFLRRELDFYIKNEIVDLDALGTDDERNVDEYLSRVRAMKKISHRIIDFIAQIEEFQRNLFEKKKFVTNTEYCFTLDRIPESFYDEILENEAQLNEWRELHALDVQDTRQLHEFMESGRFDRDFLRNNPYMIVDTKHFDDDFKQGLISGFEDLESEIDGLLIHGENFQALNLIEEKYRGEIDAVYIDPPFNAHATEILYKNEYKHSSWLSLIADRLETSLDLINSESKYCITIDDNELHRLLFLTHNLFGEENHLATVPVRSNPQGRSTVKGFSINHEYATFYSVNEDASRVGRLEHTEEQIERYDEVDENGNRFLWENFRKTGTDSERPDRPQQFYPIIVEDESPRIPEMTWDSGEGEWDIKEEISESSEIVYPIDSSGTERVWKWGVNRARRNPNGLKCEKRGNDYQIYRKNYLNQEGSLPNTWWDDAKYAAGSHGTNLLTNLFGTASRKFIFPKSVYAVEDSLRVCNLDKEGTALDFFAGSGTTAHAVMNLNRNDGGNRKYILVEMGDYFETVLMPRLKKVTYSDNWKDGMPQDNKGISQGIKYHKIESYEDALNNIAFRDEDGQVAMDEFDDYLLNYMLDFETKESPSRLNVDKLTSPFEYELKIRDGDETRRETVDLVETFNYILGVKVSKTHLDFDDNRKYCVVKGTVDGEKVSIVWRNTDDLDSKEDFERDKKFIEERLLDGDEERVYANGVCSIENVKSIERTFKPAIGA